MYHGKDQHEWRSIDSNPDVFQFLSLEHMVERNPTFMSISSASVMIFSKSFHDFDTGPLGPFAERASSSPSRLRFAGTALGF